MLLDYLNRAPAKVVAYDVDFADADTRRGFDFGGSVISRRGIRSADDRLERSTTGNLYMLADSTYEAQEGARRPDSRRRFPHRRSRSARAHGVFPPFPALAAAAAGLGHNLFVLDPDGPLRHTVPFVRTGERVDSVVRPGGGAAHERHQARRREVRRQSPPHRRPRPAPLMARRRRRQRRGAGSVSVGDDQFPWRLPSSTPTRRIHFSTSSIPRSRFKPA